MKKAILAVVSILALSGCATQYTYEADPIEDDQENPRNIECFIVEADAASDEDDVQLGEFCKSGSNRGEEEDD